MDLTFLGSERKSMSAPYPLLQQARAYWEALREGGALPRRDAIDPRGLSGALEHVFLIERVAPGQARFRLAGMHLVELMGMEVRGMPLFSLVEPSGRMKLAEALEAAFTAPSALELWLEAERGIGRPALEGRMLILPVTGHAGEPNLALGCLETHGSIGRSPRRFAISGLVREPLVPGRARPDALAPGASLPEPPLATSPVPGLAETQAPFQPAPPRGRPNLRLVHSRD